MIYLDNGATSWPKPEQVYQAVDTCLRAAGNPSRGVNNSSLQMSRVLYDARLEVARLFNIDHEERLVFTKNITESINLVMKSLLKPGDHVLISSVEHNAVVRPLEYLQAHHNVSYDVVPTDDVGRLNPETIREYITDKTKLIAVTHASNVLGTVLPIQDISRIAKEANVYLLVDAAQTAGAVPVDVKEMGADFLAFTGHKSLLGPQGTGGLYINEGIFIEPLIHGGTGINSREIKQSGIFPDDFESGTVNIPGIAGLAQGVKYCRENMSSIMEHKQKLLGKLMNYLLSKSEIQVLGPNASCDFNHPGERAGLVTFNIRHLDSDRVGLILDSEYSITTRTGLHCSPLAHETAMTLDLGGVRVSPGPFTTEDELDQFLVALDEIVKMES